jgi:hypothetical protein
MNVNGHAMPAMLQEVAGQIDAALAVRTRPTARMRMSRSDTLAVNVAVKEIKNDNGRLACELAGLVIAGAPPGTRTPNPRIKSRGHGAG